MSRTKEMYHQEFERKQQTTEQVWQSVEVKEPVMKISDRCV